MNPSPISSLYSSKLVLLYEVKPLTDHFEQLMLTEKQLKAVIKVIFEMLPKCDSCEDRKMTTNDEVAVDLENVQTIFTQEEIDDTE